MNLDRVPGGQCEFVRWNDPGAGEKKTAGRKFVVAKKKRSEFSERALHLCERSLPGKNQRFTAADGEINRCFRRQVVAHDDARPECAATAIDFRLWQIERVF